MLNRHAIRFKKLKSCCSTQIAFQNTCIGLGLPRMRNPYVTLIFHAEAEEITKVRSIDRSIDR